MRLIIFTRYPEAGLVKTRLIPALGEKGAELLHRDMAEHTIAQARHFRGEVEICFTGGTRRLMKQWLGKDLLYREQKGSSLGERLSTAITKAFSGDNKKVAVIGTDCPALTTAHINRAFQLLDSSDLVLGPAYDGGYYLIGLRNANQKLFRGISWGSENVYLQTTEAADRLDLKTSHLEKLADVDCPADLPAWANRRTAKRQG